MNLILVVEDNDVDFDLLMEFLTPNHLVARAKDGADAIQKLQDSEFSAALIDMKLPGHKTGVDVAAVASEQGVPCALFTNSPALARVAGSKGEVLDKDDGGAGVLRWLNEVFR